MERRTVCQLRLSRPKSTASAILRLLDKFFRETDAILEASIRGRIYQQTFIDTYSKVAFAKLYDRKNALVAADILNDRILPFLEEQDVPLLRILTDRGTEYCGKQEHHEYTLTLPL